jgi:guanylate kinase
MSKLIVVSAPSGAGKTTLCERLLKEFPELTLSISSTTRAPRGQERDGKDYYFLSKRVFEEQIRAGRFAEWAEVHGYYYGTSKDTIERTLEQGKSVLLDIDVQGAESLRKSYPKQCLSFFIAPPDLKALEIRLRGRGTDSEETIQKRLRNAIAEMQEAPRFHHCIVNDNLERAYQKLRDSVGEALRADSKGEKNG